MLSSYLPLLIHLRTLLSNELNVSGFFKFHSTISTFILRYFAVPSHNMFNVDYVNVTCIAGHLASVKVLGVLQELH